MWYSIDNLLGRVYRVGRYPFQFVGYDPKTREVRLRPYPRGRSQPVPVGLFFAALWEGAIEEL